MGVLKLKERLVSAMAKVGKQRTEPVLFHEKTNKSIELKDAIYPLYRSLTPKGVSIFIFIETTLFI